MLNTGRPAILYSKRALLQSFALSLVCAVLCNSAYAQPRTETIIHNFSPPPKGSYPDAALVQDLAGNLYGTTGSGGRQGGGTVFQFGPGNAALSSLHSFRYHLYDSPSDNHGAEPYSPAGIVMDGAGNLYGIAYSASGASGLVYKLTPTGELTVLHMFPYEDPGGSNPTGGLLLDSSGNLYGSTLAGGASGYGVVFKLDPAGNETVLHSFEAGAGGADPNGNLVFDASGYLIGTTQFGGTYNAGVVFRLSPNGTETVLYTFTGNADGFLPNSGVTLDSAGNIYGTTEYGGFGAKSDGYGVVFTLDAQNNFTVLHAFQSGVDTANPNSPLVIDQNGNLYGTTDDHRQSKTSGAVFKISAAGEESILLAFTDLETQGAQPLGLLLASNGELYGITTEGGASGVGLLYSLTLSGQQTVLYTFPNSQGGYSPISNLAFDQSGNLWGVTDDGPYNNTAYKKGNLFKIDPSSGQETVVYNSNYRTRSTAVVFDQAGNAYGENEGGAFMLGEIYKITPQGQLISLYSFNDTSYNGYAPEGGLAIDSLGNLYGATVSGGEYDSGVVFKLDPSGNYSVLTQLYLIGGMPMGPLTLDSAGNLYGTTSYGGEYNSGTVFELSPTGDVLFVYSFPEFGAGGSNPATGVVVDSNGNIYGTNMYGGAYGSGVVFEFSSGVERVLLNFDGALPNQLVRDARGNIYGTTSDGEMYSYGTIFEISAEGVGTVLHTFTGAGDGGVPEGGLLLGPSGALYGTASFGGKYTGGVLFELK